MDAQLQQYLIEEYGLSTLQALVLLSRLKRNPYAQIASHFELKQDQARHIAKCARRRIPQKILTQLKSL